jgi:aconitate hydratase
MSSSRLASSPLLRGAAGLSRQSTLARSMATVKSSIGNKKVEMSNLEKGKYINYQRIEDNLQVVRSR